MQLVTYHNGFVLQNHKIEQQNDLAYLLPITSPGQISKDLESCSFFTARVDKEEVLNYHSKYPTALCVSCITSIYGVMTTKATLFDEVHHNYIPSSNLQILKWL